MGSPLDGITERHEGPEPKVLTEDVQKILKEVIRPGDPDQGKPVELVAAQAGVSTRTVYRVIQGESLTLSLDTADDLVLACNSHLALCRLVWPDGAITSYQELRS